MDAAEDARITMASLQNLVILFNWVVFAFSLGGINTLHAIKFPGLTLVVYVYPCRDGSINFLWNTFS
jgi:hypothetical protein